MRLYRGNEDVYYGYTAVTVKLIIIELIIIMTQIFFWERHFGFLHLLCVLPVIALLGSLADVFRLIFVLTARFAVYSSFSKSTSGQMRQG